MSQNQYFRAGAGAVIYNQNREIYVFKRIEDNDIWQFPQGGMDAGEQIETTLWRELEEETGLKVSDILKTTPYPHWLSYSYPDSMRPFLRDPNCLGQIHKWFYLEIRPGTKINLSDVSHPEFSDYRLTTFPLFLKTNDRLKGDVFKELANFFDTI